jgi:hypothetical protein
MACEEGFKLEMAIGRDRSSQGLGDKEYCRGLVFKDFGGWMA